MSMKKTLVALVVLSSLLSSPGCLPKKADRGMASSARSTPRFKMKPAARTSDPQRKLVKMTDDGISSPEDSMKRDLKKLVEKEREQAKTVNQMRSALTEGEEIIAKEEQKLEELRVQIAQYQDAMQKYESPARGGNIRGREMTRTASPQPGYAPERYVDAPRSGEEVLYAGGPGGVAPQPAARNDYAGTRTYTSAPQPQPAPQNMAAAPRANANQTYFEPPASLFSDAARFSQPMMPTPAPRAAAQPQYSSQAPQTSGAMAQAPRQNPAPAVSPAPASAFAPSPFAQPAVSYPASGAKPAADDVFMPDLYLSGGR